MGTRTAPPALGPAGTLDLPAGLVLAPRLKLLLTVFRSDPSPKPVDEWRIRSSLLDFLRASLAVVAPEDDDVQIRRAPDLKKRKRDEPVASGTLFIRDLEFLKKAAAGEEDGVGEERRFLEWRRSVVEKMEGMELNIEGVKFRLSVELPTAEDFQKLMELREGIRGSGNYNRGGYHSRATRQPDTLILEGLPSRWFAEPRVSSKPSMLVTHTIFSVFGEIRNLNVAGADDLGKTAEEAINGPIVSGLRCKIWVQFEKQEDLLNALKILCGRSMQKQGSRLRADYEISWDKDDFFRSYAKQNSTRSQIEERINFRDEAPVHRSKVSQSRYDGARPRRFRE